MKLSKEEIERYSRQIVLRGVGGPGQNKLRAARALAIGAGGLGSPALQYLAGAGVGTLGVVDDDIVSLSNLHRQVLHATGNVGRKKVDSAEEAIARLNPHVEVVKIERRLDEVNARALVADWDVVLDGSDNFATRYALTEACFRKGTPLVAASLAPFEGQLSTFKPYLGSSHPCYRCLYREPPPPDLIPRCETAGILGAVAGVLGTLQAVEVLKELLGLGESLSGTLLLYDALRARCHRIAIPKDPDCPTCGRAA